MDSHTDRSSIGWSLCRHCTSIDGRTRTALTPDTPLNLPWRMSLEKLMVSYNEGFLCESAQAYHHCIGISTEWGHCMKYCIWKSWVLQLLSVQQKRTWKDISAHCLAMFNHNLLDLFASICDCGRNFDPLLYTWVEAAVKAVNRDQGCREATRFGGQRVCKPVNLNRRMCVCTYGPQKSARGVPPQPFAHFWVS